MTTRKELNDQLRTTLKGGKILLSAMVRFSDHRDKILSAVQQFNDFNENNDPHKEHDFGIVVIGRDKYMFKIDYHSHNLNIFEEDTNEHHVLTIMHEAEY